MKRTLACFTVLFSVGFLGIFGIGQAAMAATTASATTCTGVNAPSPCLDYHGGGMLFEPRVHPIFWGSWWNTSTGTATQGYIDSLLLGLGKSQDRWTTILNQYGSAIQPYYKGIGLDGPLLDGSTVDTSNPPPRPTDQQIGQEATKGALAGAVIPLVLTPPHVTPAHDTANVCAHHWDTYVSTPNVEGYLSWAEVPYGKASSFGCNLGWGTLAGWSILIGHEIAETITDPYPNGTPDGGTPTWFNSKGQEVADPCEPAFDTPLGVFYAHHLFTLKLPTGSFAMQELWSNSARSCVQHS